MWPKAVRPGSQTLVNAAKEFNCYRKLGRSIVFTDADVWELLDRIKPHPTSPVMSGLIKRTNGHAASAADPGQPGVLKKLIDLDMADRLDGQRGWERKPES